MYWPKGAVAGAVDPFAGDAPGSDASAFPA